jgi:enoyl-CoA hydratase/carnithine racemase
MPEPVVATSFPVPGVGQLRFISGRPANVMTDALVTEMLAEVGRLSKQPHIRVLMIQGADGTFSGGADLSMMAGLDEAAYRAYIEAEFALFDAVEQLPFLTLAVIDGSCLGNAAELALACDLRIASDEARYGFPETRIGFQGPASRVVRHVGLGVAKHLLYSGEVLTASEARGAGLLTWQVPAADLPARALEQAVRFAAMPAVALRETKQNLAAAFPHAEQMVANELRSSMRTYQSEDSREGRTAFLEKRPAVFRGA